MTARDYFLLGAAKYKCNACDYAVKDFSKAIQLDEKYPEAYYGRSLAYRCLGEYRSALRDIESAIRHDPTEVLYREARGRILASSGDNSGAVREFSESIKMDSLCWQAWYGLARVRHAAKDFDKARTGYDKAILYKPDFAMARIGLGELELDLGNNPQALATLSVAAELEPEYAPIYELRSLSFLRIGSFDQAEEDADKATKLAPASAEAWFHRAEARAARESWSLADADYEHALKLNKKFSEAWFRRGICTEKLNDDKKARKFYSKAIRTNKQHKQAYVHRAHLWKAAGKPKKAIPDLDAAINLDSKDFDLYLERGFMKLELEQHQRALHDFSHVTKKEPENGTAFYGLGLAKYQAGNVNAACQDFIRALELGEERAAEQVSKYCVE